MLTHTIIETNALSEEEINDLVALCNSSHMRTTNAYNNISEKDIKHLITGYKFRDSKCIRTYSEEVLMGCIFTLRVIDGYWFRNKARELLYPLLHNYNVSTIGTASFITIEPSYRGLGYGTYILNLALQSLKDDNYLYYLYFGADSEDEHSFHQHVLGNKLTNIGALDFNDHDVQIMKL